MEEFTHTPRKRIYKPKTPTKTTQKSESEWYALDLRNQGIASISPVLFTFTFIYELYLDNNYISCVPDAIENLKNLQVLDLSNNLIKTIPASISKLVNLKELNFANNNIGSVPTELGSLFNCSVINLDNNPLIEPFASIYKNRGGRALLNFCKDHHMNYAPPLQRSWVSFDESVSSSVYYNEASFFFSLGSYNVLSNTYATEQFFNYAPVPALKWENRKGKLINEIINHDLDILCAQEVETEAFVSFFRDQLAAHDYDSLFYPKGRAKSMCGAFNQVDGCATFWKKSKFSMIEHKCVEFTQVILSDKRFNENVDIINRNVNKDNIALVTVMKSKDSVMQNNETILIIANVHVAWDPEFRDVKLMQTIILTEEIMRMKMRYLHAGIILAGDFNSLYDSDVYKMLTTGRLEPLCADFDFYNYTPYTSSGFHLNLNLADSYKTKKDTHDKDIDEESTESDEDALVSFTNWTAQFKAVIDYIFYSENRIECLSVLAGIDRSYENNIVGLPSAHLPSDHILIAGKYCCRIEKKIKK